MKLFISTLGAFDIKNGETSLLKESSRSYKLHKLLQYFITFRNKKILSESIIENVWPNHESYDPQNMLRAQIYRLRQFIKSAIPEGEDETLYMGINFNNGYYSLDIGEKVVIDIDEFTKLITLGDNSIINDINSSVNYYEKALELYKGIYLEENAYELWLVPVKNYYRKLFIKTLFKLLDIYNEKKEYQKIVDACQNAITYEAKDVNIHIYLMETMLKLGQAKDAMNHYEYATFLLNKERLETPSLALQDINRKIKSHLSEKSKTNIINIKTKLQEENENGALLCSFDYLKFLFNIQKRKRNIEEEPAYITLITLEENLKEEELKHWINTMTEVLKNTLRRGDAFTFWNEAQILILLQNIKGQGLRSVEERIKDKLKFKLKDRTYNIKIKSSLVEPETSII